MKVNEAAKELCLQNPELLSDRAKLLSMCREKFHDEGYEYRKGVSRSKRLHNDKQSTPKRSKLSEDVRLRRIAELHEDIKDTSDQIKIKEKRRSLASASKDCDRLTSQISALRQKLREHQSELNALQKKQRKSKWYKDRRSGSDKSVTLPPLGSPPSDTTHTHVLSSSSLHVDTLSPHTEALSSSGSFCTPSPLMSPTLQKRQLSLSSPSPKTSASPSPIPSPMISSSDSESSHDTVILTSEDEQVPSPLSTVPVNTETDTSTAEASAPHFQ